MGVTLIQIFIHFPGDVERENWLRPTPFLIFITLLEKYSQKKKEKKKGRIKRPDTSTLSSSSALRLTFFSQTRESVIICKLASSGTLAGEIDSSHSEISTGKSSGVCRL